MPERLIGLVWDSTTGPRVITADPLIRTAYQIIVDQQRKIEALQLALNLSRQESADLRAQNTAHRRRWFGR